ncbi:hypothetical protein BDZ97DRAFT_1819850 [Flammula alnicola]|nr:hypothetical protein BDZ97DRAFT_1819850 [Flammula alnicola]
MAYIHPYLSRSGTSLGLTWAAHCLFQFTLRLFYSVSISATLSLRRVFDIIPRLVLSKSVGFSKDFLLLYVQLICGTVFLDVRVYS